MNDRYSPEELQLIAQVEASSKWDNLTYHLSILVPSFIIIGLGIHFSSPLGIVTGMVVYAVVLLWALARQARMNDILKSVIRKTTENLIANNTSELTSGGSADASPRRSST